jgi:hypothetical protein
MGTKYLVGRSTAILKLEADAGVSMSQVGDTLLIGASGLGGTVTGTGTPETITKWITASKVGNSVLVESAGKIGIGGVPTSTFHAQSTADEAVQLQAQNINGAGTTASASFRAAGDVAQAVFIAHGSGRVVARCGITLGAYSEIYGGTSGNGMLIDLGVGAGALILGTGNTERIRLPEAGGAELKVKVTKYNSVTTAGWGVPAIQAAARSTAQTAAVASVAAYTLGAADGSVVVSANVNVTTSTLHSFSVQVDYTDETNTARTVTLTFSQLNATLVSVITNATGAGPYEGVPVHLRCKASTTITVKTVGTFTTVTYNVEGAIQQIA